MGRGRKEKLKENRERERDKRGLGDTEARDWADDDGRPEARIETRDATLVVERGKGLAKASALRIL